MLNRFDFALAPEDLFLNPGADPGLRLLAEPEFFWRPLPRARITGHAASEHEAINRKIDSFLSYTARHKTFSAPVEFNTVPVVLEDALFKKSFLTVGGKGVLNGASGLRLLNRYVWTHQDQDWDAEARLADWFDACQQENTRLLPPRRAATAGLPFAVECRNTFNYYHYLTESLCQFCTLDDIGHDRPIFLHYPNSEDKTRSFARNFLTALFPEFGDRVIFERAPRGHDRALAAFNLQHAWYQFGDDIAPPMDRLITSTTMWAGRRATRASHGVLAMNSVDRNLIRLRDRALAAIAGRDFSHLPRRFWIGRAPGQSRTREMQGESELLEMLGLFGFEQVAFETLTPIEQIALMARAEVMISTHGAGFANMVFANPEAHVIEIGTLQTAMFRWGDFWRHAAASGCHYTSFYADFAKDDPLREPNFATDGIVPVALSRHGLAVLMTFLAALLGHAPRLPSVEQVLRVARQMNQIGAYSRTAELAATNAGAEEGNPALCQAYAEAFRHLGQGEAELAALESAARAEPTRAHPLLQVFWCAQKIHDHAASGRALTRLRADFPDRYGELVKSRPWVARYA